MAGGLHGKNEDGCKNESLILPNIYCNSEISMFFIQLCFAMIKRQLINNSRVSYISTLFLTKVNCTIILKNVYNRLNCTTITCGWYTFIHVFAPFRFRQVYQIFLSR